MTAIGVLLVVLGILAGLVAFVLDAAAGHTVLGLHAAGWAGVGVVLEGVALLLGVAPARLVRR